MSAILVETKTGKKGYVYYGTLGELEADKLQVKVVDDDFKETGENLLCVGKSLKAIGFKD